eukprot:m.237818 g.237818  ORF g.237818 m.237818 type:complete len:535 (+) comp15798_c0_seq2:176-1780(+)
MRAHLSWVVVGAAAVLSRGTTAQCPCYGCDGARSFDLTPAIGNLTDNTAELLWSIPAVSSAQSVQCVGSGDGGVLCGYQIPPPAKSAPSAVPSASLMGHGGRIWSLPEASNLHPDANGQHPPPRLQPAPAVDATEGAGHSAAQPTQFDHPDRQVGSLGTAKHSPSLTAFDADTGRQLFNSTALPTSDTVPVVTFDTVPLVVTTAGVLNQMAAVGIDGEDVGPPLVAPLSNAFPPAVTENGVVMWLMPRGGGGELAGYLANGVPHASMDIVGTPYTIAVISDNAVVFGTRNSTGCAVMRVDVARTMNNRFSVAWKRSIRCPGPPTLDSSRSVHSYAPAAVAGQVAVFQGPSLSPEEHSGTDRGGGWSEDCGGQLIDVDSGSTVHCVPTGGHEITTMAVASNQILWLLSPGGKALYRVDTLNNYATTKIPFDPATQDDGVGTTVPTILAVAASKGRQFILTLATNASTQSTHVVCSVLRGGGGGSQGRVETAWTVVFPGCPDPLTSASGVSTAVSPSGVTRLVVTVGSAVFAVGAL